MSRQHTKEEKERILSQETSGKPITEICRKNGITRTTFYEWEADKNAPRLEGLSADDIRKMKKDQERLMLENQILASANCSKTASVEARKAAATELAKSFPLKTVCRILNVSKSAIHYRRDYKPEKNKIQLENDKIVPLIKDAFDKSRQTYGSMKIKHVLEGLGYHISRARVTNLMEQNHLVCLQKRYRGSDEWMESCRTFPNRLRGHLIQSEPDKAWCSDCTYIAVCGVWCYLCAVIDLYSRKVLAWDVSDAHTPGFVKRVFLDAFEKRGKPKGLLFHTDQGRENVAYELQKTLSALGVGQSFSRPGTPMDNAVAESFFKLLKCECIRHKCYSSLDELRAEVSDYVRFFNEERIHSRLHFMTPCEVERKYHEHHANDKSTGKILD